MAVAHDAWSESHTGTSGSTSEASFSWTHTPSGTPRGVVVFVGSFSAGVAGDVSVTYGTAAMNRLEAYPKDAATEPTATRAYFLGVGIPTGSQTVTVNRNNDAQVMYAQCVTVTASGDTWIPPSWKILQADGTYSEQSIDGGSGTAQRYAFGFSGANSITSVSAGPNSLLLGAIDAGNYGWIGVQEGTAGSGFRSVGMDYGTTDDRAAIHLAVAEIPSSTAYHEYASQSHAGNGESTSEASFSWGHDGVSPAGAVVVVVSRTASGAGQATAVTYGGVSMSKQTALALSGSPGAVQVFFLGSSISTGPQTVVVSRNNNATPMWAWCATVQASTAGSTEINAAGAVSLTGSGDVAEQSVTDSVATGSQRYGAGYLAHNPPTVAGTNSTILQRHDFTLSSAAFVAESSPGNGSRSVGLVNALSDVRTITHFAVQLVAAAASAARPWSQVFILD